MFEPNPKRAAELERKSAGAPTIHVVAKAVSNRNGSATFHIAGYDDCSSLQNFDAAANTAIVDRFDRQQIGQCLLNRNGATKRVNLELFSPETKVAPGKSITIAHTYEITTAF